MKDDIGKDSYWVYSVDTGADKFANSKSEAIERAKELASSGRVEIYERIASVKVEAVVTEVKKVAYRGAQ